MTKQFVFQKTAAILSIAIFLLSACNSGADENVSTNTSTVDSTKPSLAPAAPVTAGLGTGILDTLWITALDFKKLDKPKAVFIFYFGTNDTISIDGWKDKGGANPFNTDPDVRFLKGKPDAVLTYGPGTYFGNLVVKNVNQLINKIDANQATHVIFAPYKFGNHVYYKIFLSKEPHMISPKAFELIPTGDEANPTPPKKYE